MSAVCRGCSATTSINFRSIADTSSPPRTEQRFWSARLSALGEGIKVGIAWRGGVPRTRQALRSIALPQWLPLLQLPGVHFVSLQHGGCDDDYREVAARSDVRIAHWQSAIDDLDEAAALIASLDAVISVCGSVVHLAGAVGKTTLVLVPACPEWRYLGAGDTMPWYPAVRLFRQTDLGDWHAPFAAISAVVVDRRSALRSRRISLKCDCMMLRINSGGHCTTVTCTASTLFKVCPE